MVKIITDVSLFLNVGKNMSDVQIGQTADMIIKDYNFLKVEDFKLCFNNAKKGIYGKQYDRLDGQIIFEWLDIYVNDRATEAERLSFEKHKEDQKIKNNEVNPEGQRKVLEAMKGALDHIDVKEVKKIKRVSERDPRLTIFFSEYEKLPKIKEIYVQYKGKNLSQTEYIDVRIEEYNKEIKEDPKQND